MTFSARCASSMPTSIPFPMLPVAQVDCTTVAYSTCRFGSGSPSITWARRSSGPLAIIEAPASTPDANVSSAFSLSPAASKAARSGTKVLNASEPTSGEYTCMNRLTGSPVILLTLSFWPSAHSIDLRVLPGAKRSRRLNKYMSAPICPGLPSPMETPPVRGREERSRDARLSAGWLGRKGYSSSPVRLPEILRGDLLRHDHPPRVEDELTHLRVVESIEANLHPVVPTLRSAWHEELVGLGCHERVALLLGERECQDRLVP